MKSIPTLLNTHINQSVTAVCTLWTVIRTDGTVLGFTDHNEDITYNVTPLPDYTHRYWRVYVTANNGGSGYYTGIAELEMRATAGGADLCVGGTPSASSEGYGGAVENAFDGDTQTRWLADSPSYPSWIAYDFGTEVEIREVAITSEHYAVNLPGTGPRNFRVEYSDDGVEWETAWEVWDQTGWEVTETRVFTDPDIGITLGPDQGYYGEVLYRAKSGYTRTAVEATSMLNVDTMEIEGFLDSEAITDEDLRSGLYDYAEVLVSLINYEDLDQGHLLLRRGRLGEITQRDHIYVTEIRSLAQYLMSSVVEVYTPDCRAEFCDDRCGLNKADHTYSGSVYSVGAANRAAFEARFDNYDFQDGRYDAYDGSTYLGWTNTIFTGGLIIWKTGKNAGRSMEVKSYNASYEFDLFLAMPDVIEVGDTFDVVVGCDKSIQVCSKMFNNVVNFRGEPYIPNEDKVFSFPDAK